MNMGLIKMINDDNVVNPITKRKKTTMNMGFTMESMKLGA